MVKHILCQACRVAKLYYNYLYMML